MIDAVVNIDPLSCSSLRLETSANGVLDAVASGFVVGDAGQDYLVTNYHVVSARDPSAENRQYRAACPDELDVTYLTRTPGKYIVGRYKLMDEDWNPRFLVHPEAGVDVALLPVTIPEEAFVCRIDQRLVDSDMQATVGMLVHIVGFPLGYPPSGLTPIWKTGHIANEPELHPTFLVDARTHGGMSGSPVILRSTVAYNTRDGTAMNFPRGGVMDRFMGIYSGRLEMQVAESVALQELDLGIVWKPKFIAEIIDHHRARDPYSKRGHSRSVNPRSYAPGALS